MDLGQRVKSVRKERGLSQTELSKKLGIDQSLISYLESGKGSGSTHIASIAHALGVNAHWLETGQGSPELDYIRPVVVDKKYCKEIAEAIRLMELSDDRGRLKMLIALQDADEAHKARKAFLAREQGMTELNQYAKQLADELLPKALESIEKSTNDVYIAERQEEQDQKDKRH